MTSAAAPSAIDRAGLEALLGVLDSTAQLPAGSRAAPPARSASRKRSSTHAHTLDRLPPRLMVYRIEGEDFLAGDELGAPMRAAVDAARRELRERLVMS